MKGGGNGGVIQKQKHSPKKQKVKATSPMRDGDDDPDNASDNATDANAAADNETAIQDQVKDKLSALSEKRSSTRVDALTYIIKLLRFHQWEGIEALKASAETLMYSINALGKKTGTPDFIPVMKLFQLVALTCVVEPLSMFQDQVPILHKIIVDDTVAPEERAAAVETLSVVTWINLKREDLEWEEQTKVMAILDAVLADLAVAPDVLAATLTALSLILATRADETLAGSLYNKYIPVMANLLSHPVQKVKQSVGQIIAMLQEAKLTCDEPDEEEGEIDSALEEISNSVASLAEDATRKIGKQERAQQKSFFREILKAVETMDPAYKGEYEPPWEKMEIKKTTNEFTGWKQVAQLDAMRSLLKAGLVDHFVNNEVLGEAFDIVIDQVEEEAGESNSKRALEKARQEIAKDQRNNKAKERKKKNAFRDDAGFDD